MSSAKITLIGLYNYMIAKGEDLFGNMRLPSAIDKSKLINVILLRGGEFESLYSNPDFVKFAIGSWSDKWYDSVTRLCELNTKEYTPLENFDRYEDYTDNNTGTQTYAHTGTITNGHDGDVTLTHDGNVTDTTIDMTTVNQVSAYDSDEFQNSSKDSVNGATRTNYDNSDKTKYNNIDTQTNDNQDIRTDDLGSHHVGHLHGNIGVTTSEQMWQAFSDLHRNWSLYDVVAEMFLGEFIIPIY